MNKLILLPFAFALSLFQLTLAMENGGRQEQITKTTTDVRMRELIAEGADLSVGAPLCYIRGNEELCRLLIESGARVNAKDEEGNIPLMYAFYSEPVFNLLLDAKADVNAKNHNGTTPLIKAADDGKVEICVRLLQANARINDQDNKGDTALIKAANIGHPEIYRLLIDAGADIYIRNIRTEYTLKIVKRRIQYNIRTGQHWASHEEIRKMLVQTDQATKNLFSRMEEIDKLNVQLLAAANDGNTEQVTELLAAGALCNARDLCYMDLGCPLMYTPLIYAAGNKHELICELLIAAGADLNAKTHKGLTALREALFHPGIRSLLLQHGADVNCQDEEGITPLIWTSRLSGYDDYEISQELLVNYHADMHLTDANGRTALITAASYQNEDVCELLVNHQRALDQGIVVAIGCIKKMGKHSLSARSLHHERHDLLAPYMRPYLKTHSLKAMLSARDNEKKRAFDYMELDILDPGNVGN